MTPTTAMKNAIKGVDTMLQDSGYPTSDAYQNYAKAAFKALLDEGYVIVAGENVWVSDFPRECKACGFPGTPPTDEAFFFRYKIMPPDKKAALRKMVDAYLQTVGIHG